MSFLKRIRIMWYAASQEWHEQTCGECGDRWMAVGPERKELIRICDACEVKELAQFQAFAEQEFQRITKGAFS
jgi:hypothetical protein